MSVPTVLRLALLPAAAALLLAAAACGGGSGDADAAPTATATPEGVLPLQSFHYVASLTLQETKVDGAKVTVSTEGDYQEPDRHAFTYLTGLGDGSIRRSAVIIGEQAWLREGDGAWRELARDDPDVVDLTGVAFSTIRPQFLGGEAFARVRESVRRLPSTEEFVNEILSDHYRVAASSIEALQSVFASEQLLQDVEDLRWDLWLAQDGGWPVRLVATGTVTQDLQILGDLGLEAPTAWELRVDITRANDPALTVEAPDGG